MNAKSFQVALATGLGAFVGSLLALELGGWMWWLGALTGGLVGYLTYEFKAVLKALPVAWRAAWTAVAWRPPAKTGKVIRRIFVPAWLTYTYGYVSYGIPFLTGFPLFLSAIPNSQGDYLNFSWASLVGAHIFGYVLFGVIALSPAVFTMAPSRCYSSRYRFRLLLKANAKFRRGCNPALVYGYWLPRGLWWLVTGLGQAIICLPAAAIATLRLVLSFVKALFLAVHSEIRLLCGVDAAIGATIGYFSGNAVFGLMAGGVVGVLNFELVSKRWLRLVPNGQVA